MAWRSRIKAWRSRMKAAGRTRPRGPTRTRSNQDRRMLMARRKKGENRESAATVETPVLEPSTQPDEVAEETPTDGEGIVTEPVMWGDTERLESAGVEPAVTC